MRKGFTLIELLAVITILAIILLIVVPIFTGIIKNSKEKTRQDSVALYGRAIENAIAEYFVKYPLKNEVDYSTLESENLINFKGKGQIKCEVTYIIDRSVYLDKCTVNGKSVEATYGKSFGVLVEENTDNNGNNETNNTSGGTNNASGGANNASSGVISVGDKYLYRVNKQDTFYFYVLSVENDNVNLIMDRNICEDGTAEDVSNNNICKYTWNDYGINGKGPITAMQKLYNATKEWTNVPDIQMDYTDEANNGSVGYGKVFTSDNGIYITEKSSEINLSNPPTITYTDQKLKARLPEYNEIMDEENNTYCADDDDYHCPSWLFNNMSDSGFYWTLSSHYFSENNVMCLNRVGIIVSAPANELAGLRPVITVPKTYLSK